MDVSSELPASTSVDAVVLAVPHHAYKNLDLEAWLGAGQPAVLDANAVLTEVQRRAVIEAGCAFAAIGSG